MMRRNTLNDLDAKAWLKFTKSWFLHNPPPRSAQEKLHPAKYPESMIRGFIEFFTRRGETVFDPFLGTGSTLVAAQEAGRNGIGIELQEKYAQIARERVGRLGRQQTLSGRPTAQQVITGDAAAMEQFHLPTVDFIITSPPYGPMLNKRGLAQQKRASRKLDTRYSDDTSDLGNIGDYGAFVGALAAVFRKAVSILRPGRHLVIIVQNYRDGGRYRMLAADIARALEHDIALIGERIWLQDNKTLFPYGMGSSFVPNIHHHYCLIFKNGQANTTPRDRNP